MNIFLLIFPFITLQGDPGAAFDKQLFPTIEDCRIAAEDRIQKGKRQFREVKAVCVPFDKRAIDPDAEFTPETGAKVGEAT